MKGEVGPTSGPTWCFSHLGPVSLAAQQEQSSGEPMAEAAAWPRAVMYKSHACTALYNSSVIMHREYKGVYTGGIINDFTADGCGHRHERQGAEEAVAVEVDLLRGVGGRDPGRPDHLA